MKHAILALVAATSAFSVGHAQQAPSYKRDLPDSLVRLAKVTEAAAVATAQKRLPQHTIVALEIERENGKLIYSFDMKLPGKPGIDEVNVDAMTGKLVGTVQHESDADEKKEAAKEAAKKPPAGKPPTRMR
jgi:uncharacterized membrane protein YkoI